MVGLGTIFGKKKFELKNFYWGRINYFLVFYLPLFSHKGY